MELWKWIAGGLGIGAAGLVGKRHLDNVNKIPRVGDVATVAVHDLSVPGLPSSQFNPLDQLSPQGIGNLPIKITGISQADSAFAVINGSAGAGIPVTFNRSKIIALTRAGKNVSL